MRTIAFAMIFGAAAIDNDWDGFVHFKNWNGGMPNSSPRLGAQFSRTFVPLSDNILKDLCAQDPSCDALQPGLAFLATFQDCALGPYSNQGCHLSQNISQPMPTTFTNTSYDMFLGIKGEPKTAPAALCTMEDGGGNSPDVKWLRCPGFGHMGQQPGLKPQNIKNHFDIPPQQMYVACLQEPDCIGFRLKNDGSGGDTLQSDGHGGALFKMP
jgi:hypothetical protein